MDRIGLLAAFEGFVLFHKASHMSVRDLQFYRRLDQHLFESRSGFLDDEQVSAAGFAG
jgi:hypothetical protein